MSVPKRFGLVASTSLRHIVAAAAALVLCSVPALAAGPELAVNAYRPSAQRDPDVAVFADGSFVVVWESQGQDGSGNDVFGQRFSAAGARIGGEFQVSQSVTFDMLLLPRVAAAPDGSFAVVWQAEDAGIGNLTVYGRWYRPDGSAVAAPRALLPVTDDRFHGSPAIDADGSGRFVVVFANFVDGGVIEGRRYSTTGGELGAIFRGNPALTGGAGWPDVAAASDGSFVVAWHEFPDNGAFRVMAQRFDAAQTPIGGQVAVSGAATLSATTPRIELAADRSFFVVWNQQETPSFGSDAFGRRFTASGAPLTAPFSLASSTGGDQTNPDVALDGAGNAVAVWQAFGPGSEHVDVLERRFTPIGTPLGPETTASVEPGVQQDEPAVSANPSGDVVAAWHVVHDATGFDVAARVLDPLGGGSFAAPAPIDFGGNGDTDVAVFRPSQGRWLADFDFQPTPELSLVYGRSGDVAVPKDYDGDGTTDLAVFRPSTRNWFVDLDRNGGTDFQVTYGQSTDVPVPADYDGDGSADLAVWRPASGTWFVDSNRNGGTDLQAVFGQSGSIPVPGDYDGDGRADFAVFHQGAWRIDTDRNGVSNLTIVYGRAGDVPMPGDYDGDGRTDFALFRPASATWFVDTNRNGGTDLQVVYGRSGDVPVAGDFNGDGTWALAVYRPSSGTWFIDTNRNGGTDFTLVFGQSGDVPLRENGWILDRLGVVP